MKYFNISIEDATPEDVIFTILLSSMGPSAVYDIVELFKTTASIVYPMYEQRKKTAYIYERLMLVDSPGESIFKDANDNPHKAFHLDNANTASTNDSELGDRDRWFSFLRSTKAICIPVDEPRKSSLSTMFATACLFASLFDDPIHAAQHISGQNIIVYKDHMYSSRILSVFVLLFNKVIYEKIFNWLQSCDEDTLTALQKTLENASITEASSSDQIKTLIDCHVMCHYTNFAIDMLTKMNEDTMRDCPIADVWYLYYAAMVEAAVADY